MNEKKTVRVKIAVAVDCDGRWCASGWGSENLMNSDHGDIIDDLAPGENQFWLYADLPVPEIQDVEATVEDA